MNYMSFVEKWLLKKRKGGIRPSEKFIVGGDERSREESLLWERMQPFGMPRDMQERMNRGR